MLLDQIDALTGQIDQLTARITALLDQIPAAWGTDADGATGPQAGAGPGAPVLPAVARLDEIAGCGVTAAQAVIAEIGLDMTVFGTPHRLVSWAKRCPATRQSGQKTTRGRQGKGNPWLAGILGEIAASAARTDTFLGERYRRHRPPPRQAQSPGRDRPLHPGHHLPPARRPRSPLPRPRPGLLRHPHRPRPQDPQPRPPAPGPRPRRHPPAAGPARRLTHTAPRRPRHHNTRGVRCRLPSEPPISRSGGGKGPLTPLRRPPRRPPGVALAGAFIGLLTRPGTGGEAATPRRDLTATHHRVTLDPSGGVPRHTIVKGRVSARRAARAAGSSALRGTWSSAPGSACC